MCTWEKRRSVAYIVVSSELRYLKSGDFFLWGRFGIRVSEILGCLSIRERYGLAVGLLCVIRKMFPYISIREDQARPCRTCRLFHSVGPWSFVARGSPVSSCGRRIRQFLWWSCPLKALSVLKGVSPPLLSSWSLCQFLWSRRPCKCHQLS